MAPESTKTKVATTGTTRDAPGMPPQRSASSRFNAD